MPRSERQAGGGELYYQAPTSGIAPNNLPYFSWDQGAAQLNRSGASWVGTLGTAVTVTYGFRASGAPAADTGVTGFQQFNAIQIQVAEQMLQRWAEVANITFTRVGGTGYTNDATILFGNFVNGPAQFSAFAYLPDPAGMASTLANGDVWVNISRDYDANPLLLQRGTQILLHEIGHTLGLLHPSEYGGGAQSGVSYEADADFWQDTRQFTVQSYFSETFTGAAYGEYWVTAPQMFDIAAAQRLYGANMTTRTGNTVYGFNSNTGVSTFSIGAANLGAVFCIWDAGGIDTLDLSGYSTNSEIDLRAESFSSAGQHSTGAMIGNISIARGVVIENAVGGTGNDIIIGNAAANVLTGGGGNDALTGGDGDDQLNGGLGADAIGGGDGFDTVRYDGATSGVTIYVDAAYANIGEAAGDNLASIEGFVGSIFNDYMVGGAANNTLQGYTGADILEGHGGNDLLDGGDGDDNLNGGLGGDILDGGAGFDVARYDGATSGVTIYVDAAYANTGEAAGDFHLSIEGIVGSTFADYLVGGTANNILQGYHGNDILEGHAGNDLLDGGDGDDQLNGGTGGDIFDGGAGYDTARYDGATSGVVAFMTDAWANTGEAAGDAYILIEALYGSNFNDTLAGASNSNELQGFDGTDFLYGYGGGDFLGGGDGNDYLDGGTGADTLRGDAGNDQFIFRAGESNGDSVLDFSGNGAAAGDNLLFLGYGTAAQGATFVQIDATHWQINSADGLIHDIITIANGASIDTGDYLFG